MHQRIFKYLRWLYVEKCELGEIEAEDDYEKVQQLNEEGGYKIEIIDYDNEDERIPLELDSNE